MSVVINTNYAATVASNNLAMSNASPNGIPFNQAVVHWALETYLGVVEQDPEPVPYDEMWAVEIVGRYETEAQTLAIRKNQAVVTGVPASVTNTYGHDPASGRRARSSGPRKG